MDRKQYGLWAFILSLVGIIIPVIPNIVSLVFAICGRRLPDTGEPNTNGFLLAGLIISAVLLAGWGLVACATICTVCLPVCGGCAMIPFLSDTLGAVGY
jgi:LPXTG-motif cell wall-anchored protein